MSEQPTMTVQGMLQAAATAKESGVPVNWEAITMTLYNLLLEANQEIHRLTPDPEEDQGD